MTQRRHQPPSAAVIATKMSGSTRRDRMAQLRQLLGASSPSRRGRPRVLLAGKLTGMSAPGGGETQLMALSRHLPRVGVDARLWRPWEERFAGFDLLHLVGSEPEHLPVAQAARRAGVLTALSTVAWFDLASYARQSPHSFGRLAACGRFVARAAFPKLPSWRRSLYHAVDLLLPNSQVEARQLTRYFGVPKAKIQVIHNGAEESFACGRPEPFVERFGVRDFVLYPGRVEPRKNQLGFLRAMRGSDVPIVVLGDVVPGNEAYLAACRRAAGANVRFVGRLDPADEMLASAYAASRCVVLASWFETPGLTALEAAMSGVPLVLPRRGAAPEYFGSLAQYVSSQDGGELKRLVLDAYRRPRSNELARLVRRQFTWQAAARATREAYEQII